MVKDKIELTPNIDVDQLLAQLEEQYQHENYNTIDGLKIDFEHGWVHLRKSNTEPIIRVYAEADTTARAEKYVSEMKDKALTLVG